LEPLAEERLHLGEPHPGLVAAVEEQDEVVHVAEVVADPERLLHEVVERIEVEVGEELARQVSDGHPPSRLLAPMLDQRGEKREQAGITHPAREQAKQHAMIDAREVALDVALDHVAEPVAGADESPEAPDGPVRAPAPDAGEGVGDEPAREQGIEDVEDRVVEYAVPEGRGPDLSPLWSRDQKAAVEPPMIDARLHVASDRPERSVEK